MPGEYYNNSMTFPLTYYVHMWSGFRIKNAPYYHVMMPFKLCMQLALSKIILLHMYPCDKSAKTEFKTGIYTYTHTGHTVSAKSLDRSLIKMPTTGKSENTQ
jgi:hypothetical protein